MAGTGKRVFVSGGNGFVASQILSDLIEHKYQVTAGVRSDAKAKEVLDLHPTWKDQLSFVTVPSFVVEKAWDHVFQNEGVRFDYIIHTASPVNFGAKDFQKDLIDPAIRGTIGLIKAAHELGGSQIKRFVLLGSAVAVLDSFKDKRSEGPDYTEKDWNPVTTEQAIESQNVVLGYNASKRLAEQAAWAFQSEKSPSFDLTVINPDVIIGPMQQPVLSAKSVNETNMFAIYNFLNETYQDIESIRFPFYHSVDVRDVSLAHVLALTAPLASNKRILLVAGLLTPQIVLNVIHKHFPALKHRLPTSSNPDQIFPEGVDPRGWDVSRSHEIFGKELLYRDIEISVVDTVNNLLELERGWK